jgi:hypothetical protein
MGDAMIGFKKLGKCLACSAFLSGWCISASTDYRDTLVDTYSAISNTPVDWNKFLLDMKKGLATLDPYSPSTEDRSQLQDFKTYLALLNIGEQSGDTSSQKAAKERIEALWIVFESTDNSPFYARFEDEIKYFRSCNGKLLDLSAAVVPSYCIGTSAQLAWQLAYGVSPILLLDAYTYLNPVVSHAVVEHYGKTMTDEGRFTILGEDKNFTVFTNIISYVAKISSGDAKAKAIELLQSTLNANKRIADCTTTEIRKRDDRMLTKKDSIRTFFNNRVALLQNALKQLGIEL